MNCTSCHIQFAIETEEGPIGPNVLVVWKVHHVYYALESFSSTILTIGTVYI